MMFKIAILLVLQIVVESKGYYSHVEKDRCLQPQVTGPCKAFQEKFYFNNHSKTCEKFIYGGCRGNKNRFDSKHECLSACSKHIKKSNYGPTNQGCEDKYGYCSRLAESYNFCFN